MRKLTLLLTTLVFSLTMMFSSTSYAEWTKVGENTDGDTYYVDFERIRKVGGYVYFWYLNNYLKPIGRGNLSSKIYKQGDCKLFRNKILSGSFYNEPMGRGTGETLPIPEKYKGWNYPAPNSTGEEGLKRVCKYAN